MNEQTRRNARQRSVVRPAMWSAVVCTALCLLIPRPGYGDPGAGSSVPDAGSVPQVSAPLLPPGANTGTPATGTTAGPYATQILSQYSTVEATGERLKEANAQLSTAQATTQSDYQTLRTDYTSAQDLARQAETAATKAYKDATALGPFGGLATDMHQLGMLAPGLVGGTGGTGAGQSVIQDAARAQAQVVTDNATYQSALANEQQLASAQSALQNQYDQQSATLTDLRGQNQQQLATAETAQQAQDAALAPLFGAGSDVNNMAASPLAIQALRFAYDQLGKDYVFSTEGPDTYDCSGLVWAAYRSAGITVPRVAAYQYHATTPVPVSQLLPGDLLFFSTTSHTDWRQISHVGMYIGDGQMIEAPHTGDVVKVAGVWWSAFFGATRVVGSVPRSTAPPTQTPPSASPTQTPPIQTPPSGSPTGNPTPTPTGKPTPSPTGKPTPTPTPTKTPPPTGTPTPSPSGTPSPAPTKPRTTPQAPSGGTRPPVSPSSSSPSAAPSSTDSSPSGDSPAPDPSPAQTPAQAPEATTAADTSPSTTDTGSPSGTSS